MGKGGQAASSVTTTTVSDSYNTTSNLVTNVADSGNIAINVPEPAGDPVAGVGGVGFDPKTMFYIFLVVIGGLALMNFAKKKR